MAKQLKTSPDGRKCTYPQCKRLLSIYNHGTYCHVHRGQEAQQDVKKNPYHNHV